MKKILFLFLVISHSVFIYAQEKSLTGGVGYVLFGEGDYSGISYFNTFQFQILNSLDLKIGIQIANASEAREEYYYDRHNVFNFANNYNLAITPIKSNLFRLTISAGGIWRYRTEIVFNNSKTIYPSDGSSLQIIENDYNKSFDLGYNVDITALIKLTERFYTGVCGQFIGYNKGSGLYSLNICFNYRL